MERPNFRIINKSKEGATLISHGQKVNVPWEEFKRLYVMSEDKMSCTLTDAEFEKWQKADGILNQIVVAMFTQRGSNTELKLASLASLPALMNQLAETMGISEQDAMELARQRFQATQRAFDGMGERPHRPRIRRSEERQAKLKSEPAPIHNSGECLGDNPLLQQLKKQMQSEEKAELDKIELPE